MGVAAPVRSCPTRPRRRRDDAGTSGGAAAGRDGRTSGSAAPAAGAVGRGKRRRAGSPSRPAAADHPPATGVNPDASLFLVPRPVAALTASACFRRHAGLFCVALGRRHAALCRRACRGAAVVAVDLAAVAAAADDHLIAAPRAQEQTARRGSVCPSSQTRRRRTPPSAGYSSCIRARHGVGHGVDAELARLARRRACPQFWQALRPPSSPIRATAFTHFTWRTNGPETDGPNEVLVSPGQYSRPNKWTHTATKSWA